MIITAQQCVSHEPYFDRYVPSESSPGHFYTVRIVFADDPPELWTCTCPSFEYRGRCKHIDLMATLNICKWHELIGPEIQTDKQKADKICPRCGNMTVETLEYDGN